MCEEELPWKYRELLEITERHRKLSSLLANEIARTRFAASLSREDGNW